MPSKLQEVAIFHGVLLQNIGYLDKYLCFYPKNSRKMYLKVDGSVSERCIYKIQDWDQTMHTYHSINS